MSEHKQKEKVIQSMLKYMRVKSNAILFVHSSFKQFSQDGYFAESVLKSLVDYMSPGILLLPTMSWRYVKPDNPFFDELNTPSNTGILTELFRTKYATHRSIHPTHSVAGIGNYVGEILSTHHLCQTPCGFSSPFAKFVECDAFIIMMGVGMDCCTLIHHVEELIAPNYYVKSEEEVETYQCQSKIGKQYKVRLRKHLFLPRNYWQFQDKLAEMNELKIFRCDNTICLGFWAKKLFTVVRNTLLNNPAAIIAQRGQRYRMM